MQKFRFSKYNYFKKLNKDYFIYNSRTGGYLHVEDSYSDFFDRNDINDLDNYIEFESNEDELKDNLIKGGFIIYDNIDEIKLIKTTYKLAEASGQNTLSITIAPTLDCNFRCVYCFKKWNGFPQEYITDEVIDAIFKYIDENLSQNGHLSISWYGGEPLLAIDKIRIFYDRLNIFATTKNISYDSFMITNGYLLTNENFILLSKYGLKNLQVTIDGTKDFHDKKRILRNGGGTFDTIIQNINNCPSDIHVSIRINIDKSNIQDLHNLIDFFKYCNLNKKENIDFYFSVIRGDIKNNSKLYSIHEFAIEEKKMNHYASTEGFRINENINPKNYSCGAISPNSLVVEPDGTIQKCYELIGDKNASIGNLLDLNKNNKDIIVPHNSNCKNILSNVSKWYSWSPFNFKCCLDCKVLPLCLGGCPLYSLDESYNLDINLKENDMCSSSKFNLDTTLEIIANNYLSFINNN